MQNETPEGYDEIAALQQRCDLLNIKYHPKAGADKLRAKLQAHENKDTIGLGKEDVASLQEKASGQPLTHAQYLRETKNMQRMNINRLIRVRLTCMNPNKTEWEGEIFSVGSAKLGTFKKYVPFNVEWHVPHILYEHIKGRQYTQFYNARGPRGEKIRKGKLANEFSVEELPPLTPKELKDLAQRQVMQGNQAA